MNFEISFLNIALVSVIILLILFLRLFFLSKHKRKIRSGKKVLNKLQNFTHDGAIFSYLRKVDPFVFEELLLSAFKEKGFNIKRNKRYTGDGGIDGQIFKDGKHYLVQAKRYSGYVNPKHIEDFSLIVKKRRADKGLFIHTGKTGKNNFNRFDNIDLISGSNLIDLIKVKKPNDTTQKEMSSKVNKKRLNSAISKLN